MISNYSLEIVHYVTIMLGIFSGLFLLGSNRIERNNSATIAFCYAIFAAIMMGIYPIPFGSGGDRELYAMSYLNFIYYDTPWSEIIWKGEWIFGSYQKIFGFLGNAQYWFILTSIIYVCNYFWAAKRLVPYSIFLMIVTILGSFSFIFYGVNTIRAGLALSYVLVGITYYKHMWKCLLLFFIAFNIHNSTAIPIAAFLVAKYYNRPKYFYNFWFFCVFLSAVMGNTFQTFFAAWGNDFDQRTNYLTTTETHYNVGFRIDFLLYGCLPIVMGYIYQKKLKYRNEFYAMLHSTYILANAFWVLVIRANFSDRFAYLSWFLYAFVMLFPLLESPAHFTKRNLYTGWIVIGLMVFVFIMH